MADFIKLTDLNNDILNTIDNYVKQDNIKRIEREIVKEVEFRETDDIFDSIIQRNEYILDADSIYGQLSISGYTEEEIDEYIETRKWYVFSLYSVMIKTKYY